MNKIIMGLIVAVCVLGMALIMLNEKLGRKPEPAPVAPIPLESPAAPPSQGLGGAALPAGRPGGGDPLPSLPASSPAPSLPSSPAPIPASDMPAVPAFSFGGDDAMPPTLPPLPQTALPAPVLPLQDTAKDEPPSPTPAATPSPSNEEHREVPVPSLASSVVAEHERKASPAPVRQEPSEKTPEKKAPEKVKLPPAPEKQEEKAVAEAPRKAPSPNIERAKEDPGKAEPRKEAPRKKEPAPSRETPAAAGKSIERFVVYVRENGATVRIVGNTNISYKPMLLTEPDRVVLDLDGDWDIKAPGIPKNKLVTNIRIGKPNGKTRVVIDLNSTAKIRYTLSRDRRMLDVRVDK